MSIKEQNLPQKSSLTRADFLRVVGSDNVSYKQPVTSLSDLMGIKYLGAFSGSSDEAIIKSALTALKTAYSGEASSTTNTPKVVAFFRSGAWGFVGTAWIRSTRVQMEVTQTNSGAQFYAFDDNGTQTVIAQPTRAEVDALKEKISYTTAFNVTQGTGDTFFYADRVGRTLFLEMVFRPASDVSANTVIAHINNIPLISRTHWSTVTHTGEPVRLVMNSNGALSTESAIGANKWVSTSCVCLMNAI